MRHHVERVRRALWTVGQPLTRKPRITGAPVSDLFVWRNSGEWKTYFELTDISGLFGDDEQPAGRYVTVILFDEKGNSFLEKRLDLIRNQRQTIDLTSLISENSGQLGTFSVFHSHTPQAVSDLGSFIAERGYVSYRYKGAPLRTYVHGNLDAISLHPDKRMQMLGASGFRKREYSLQHELRGPALYEIGIVNPCSRDQHFTCEMFLTRNGERLSVQEAQLPSKGCHVFPIRIEPSVSARIVVRSHLVMARPLVFRIHDQNLDVFHG